MSNELQWNFKQNKIIFIHENAFENVICILFNPQKVYKHPLTNWHLEDVEVILYA